MILYTISGVVPYSTISGIKLNEVASHIKRRMVKTHPACVEIQSDHNDDDIVLKFENDGVYYQLDIEA